MVNPDKQVGIDLSGSTKLLKKMPRWLAVRMNYIRVKLKTEAREDRIQRFMSFFEMLGSSSQAKILLELNGIDDADKAIKQKFKLFQGLRVYSLGVNKCNL